MFVGFVRFIGFSANGNGNGGLFEKKLNVWFGYYFFGKDRFSCSFYCLLRLIALV